jgi:CBS domain-containing protein
MIKVKHMMITDVVTANPKENIREIIRILYEKHIGSVISVNANRKCIGLFTERDALRIVAKGVNLDQPLEDVMTKNVITIHEDASINEIRQMIRTHKIRHIPVVDQDNTLVGLLSVRALQDQIFGLNSEIC